MRYRRAMSCDFGLHTQVAAALGLALVANACVGGTTRGVPLYPTTGTPRDIAEIAQLYGEIGSVDGKDLPSGIRTFELLPGCHVITTPTSWGKREQLQGASGNSPARDFAINMQPNRSYVFESDFQFRTGSGGALVVRAYEKDATGNVTATYQPAATQAELDRCRLNTMGSKQG